jgi:hypothetical protein
MQTIVCVPSLQTYGVTGLLVTNLIPRVTSTATNDWSLKLLRWYSCGGDVHVPVNACRADDLATTRTKTKSFYELPFTQFTN